MKSDSLLYIVLRYPSSQTVRANLNSATYTRPAQTSSAVIHSSISNIWDALNRAESLDQREDRGLEQKR